MRRETPSLCHIIRLHVKAINLESVSYIWDQSDRCKYATTAPHSHVRMYKRQKT